MITVARYTPEDKDIWNDFVTSSKNGTFLLDRNYMDYHSSRFEDYSLMMRSGNSLVAAFPANRTSNQVFSHQGLTYGGLLIDQKMRLTDCLEAFDALVDFLKSEGASSLLYKTIPSIYHKAPAEEDKYALFRCNAPLVRRDTLSVIDMSSRPPFQTRRKRGLAKAKKLGIQARESTEWSEYWPILEMRLNDTYGVEPTHSLEEIELLHRRFPENIRLFIAEHEGEIVAGIVIYATCRVAHCQYIAASDKGREYFALDLLFSWLIEDVFKEKTYFDFGISNEADGRILNEGLVNFKEGFGARTVTHDFYQLAIK